MAFWGRRRVFFEGKLMDNIGTFRGELYSANLFNLKENKNDDNEILVSLGENW